MANENWEKIETVIEVSVKVTEKLKKGYDSKENRYFSERKVTGDFNSKEIDIQVSEFQEDTSREIFEQLLKACKKAKEESRETLEETHG